MAKRFALVPESMLSSVQSSVQPNEEKPKISELASLLPKNMQSRARMMFHYIENAVSVNDTQRIVYDDGTVGSHVIDLVRYAISPFVKSRPVDWPQFSKLLQTLGVPESIIAKRSNQSPLLDKWKRY
jgi:hypothetical protein